MSKSVVGVLPLHNHARWVAQAVQSLCVQTHTPSAVVVVDDGSEDGGIDAIRQVMTSCSSVRFNGLSGNPVGIKGESVWGTDLYAVRYDTARGPSFARNRGIELAASLDADLIALLDSDDLYAPTKVEKSVAQFERSPLIGAVYSDYECLRPDGLLIREWKEPFSRERLLRECIVNCDSVVSLEAVKEAGGFDEELRVAEDYDLWLRISERRLIAHVPEALVTIRTGAHSSTSTVPSETWNKCWARVMQKTRERNVQTN